MRIYEAVANEAATLFTKQRSMCILRLLFAAEQRFYHLRLLFARCYLQVNQAIKIENIL